MRARPRLFSRDRAGATLMEMALVAPLLFTIVFFVLESGLMLATRVSLERAVEIVAEQELRLLLDDAALTKGIDERFRRPGFEPEARAIIEARAMGTYRTFCITDMDHLVRQRFYASAADFANNQAMSVPLAAPPAVMTVTIECSYRSFVPYVLPSNATLSGSVFTRAVVVTEGL